MLTWASRGSSPPQRALRLKTVVAFARHIHAEDDRHDVPPADTFGGYQIRRRLPFIFSRDDVSLLMEEAARLKPVGSLRPRVYSTLFGLLAVTGMRVSEALALRFEDLTAEGIVIRKTKFGKSRLVPLHESTTAAIEQYVAVRQQVSAADDHLFISWRRRRLSYSAAALVFWRLVQALRFDRRPGQRRPRLHDLRHSFATRALESSPEHRDAVGRHMVALSTYLGHSDVRNTYWYLEATPRLLTDIASTCEAHFQGGLR
ncbi:MAG: tyrosine-type recombinase/integrase [Acidobacteriota bacterium]